MSWTSFVQGKIYFCWIIITFCYFTEPIEPDLLLRIIQYMVHAHICLSLNAGSTETLLRPGSWIALKDAHRSLRLPTNIRFWIRNRRQEKTLFVMSESKQSMVHYAHAWHYFVNACVTTFPCPWFCTLSKVPCTSDDQTAIVCLVILASPLLYYSMYCSPRTGTRGKLSRRVFR